MESRHNMVRNQVRIVGMEDEKILSAMMEIHREEFVHKKHKLVAYSDSELLIDQERLIARPEMIARFLESAKITDFDIVLEVGCGTGYASHIISRIAKEVVAIDNCKNIISRAKNLSNIDNLHFQYSSFKKIKIPENTSLILVNGAIFDKRADMSVIYDQADLFNFHSAMLIDELLIQMPGNCRLFCVEGYYKYHPMSIVRYFKGERTVLEQVYFPEINL